MLKGFNQLIGISTKNSVAFTHHIDLYCLTLYKMLVMSKMEVFADNNFSVPKIIQVFSDRV